MFAVTSSNSLGCSPSFDSPMLDIFNAIDLENWQLVRQIVLRHPQLDFNTSSREGIDAGMTIPWLFAAYEQWELFREILTYDQPFNFNAEPLYGENKGMSVLWLLACHQQWDLFEVGLQRMLLVNWDAAPFSGSFKKVSFIWFLANYQQWDLLKKILKTNPQVDFNGSPSGTSNGFTIPWFLAYYRQWDLFQEVLKTYPNMNFNTCPLEGKDVGITIFWLAVFHKQWDLVRKMLEINPKINIHSSPLTDSLGKRLIDIVTADEDKSESLSALVSYLIFCTMKSPIDLLPAKGKARRESLEQTFHRIYCTFDKKQQTCFRGFPPEIIEQITLSILHVEHPECTFFLPSFSSMKFYEYQKINDLKACEKIALLVFRKFRKRHKFPDQFFSKMQIENFRKMITTSLVNTQKEREGIEYTFQNRQIIIQAIGNLEVLLECIVENTLKNVFLF